KCFTVTPTARTKPN
ncbi:modulator of DNA gyrase family protein, partial [Vibrio parahaemolyticus V-223/04]